MKYTYNSRKIVYIAMILFAISSIICFNFFSTIFKWNVDPPMYLSDVSTSVSVHQLGYGDGIDSSNTVSIGDLVEISNKYQNTTILSQYKLNFNGAGIWSNTTLKISEIIEGRGFENSDFQDKKNVVIINQDYIHACHEKDNKLNLIFDNKEFEVIGVYKGGVSLPNYIINLSATNLEDNLFVGDYVFDSSNYVEILNEAYKINPTIFIEVNGEYNLSIDQKIKIFLQEVNFIFIVIGLLPFVLLGISCIYFLYFYLEKIYDELKVYYIYGGTKNEIKKIITRDFLKISIQAYIGVVVIMIIKAMICEELYFYSFMKILVGSLFIYMSGIFILCRIFYSRFIEIYIESLWGDYDKLYEK